MRDIWFISDTHFGHSNIITYCDRPFEDAKAMDEYMIARWNSVVKPQDHVYHLGDVYFGVYGRSCLFALNGHKRLILGNHDNGRDDVLNQIFEKIVLWRVFDDFVATHMPLHPSQRKLAKRPELVPNVHGHIHNSPDIGPGYTNISVEKIGYTPVHYDEIVRMIRLDESSSS